jgi:26S proteasome regulatory subunit T5
MINREIARCKELCSSCLTSWTGILLVYCSFSPSDDIKVICATNRPDVLDPALLRSGRLDRKIEFPMPNEDARKMKHKEVNFVELGINMSYAARSTDDFNGAQLKAVCVEAGMNALRRGGDFLTHEDYVEGISQVQAKKKTNLNYYA